jgi:exopolysaccharide biosynthesis protein
MQELVIKAVAKNKRGILSNNTWYNADKALEGEVFKELSAGSVIEAEISDGKWVKEFKATGKASAKAATPAPAASESHAKRSNEFRTPEQIIRNECMNAVFASPAIAVALQGATKEEVAQTLKDFTDMAVKYVSEGAWK